MAQPSNNNNNFQSSLNPNASPHLQGSARFRIEREIADTLQGRIYSGTDLVTNKACVIKEAWKQLVHSSRSRKGHRVPENFLHEREMIMMLSNCNDAHKGIVKGIDQWDDDHCYYYAMEYCNGELFDYISKNHTSREYRNVAKMFKQICLATQWMHLKGFCHLDMSLENTMIDHDLDTLTVKIIDFGLARRFKNGDNMSLKRSMYWYEMERINKENQKKIQSFNKIQSIKKERKIMKNKNNYKLKYYQKKKYFKKHQYHRW